MIITTKQTNNWFNFYNSSLGKKIITGLTGLGLILFVLFHLLGNLFLLSDRQKYNQLGNWLESLNFLLYGVELILLIAVVFHVVVGIAIRIQSLRSRPLAYNQLKSAGTPSKQSLSSRSMALTGAIILGFLVWHLANFKFGTYYSTTVNGVPMRDLSRLVIEKFQNPFNTFGYLGAILLLGLHLRHGFWSAWQSLGVLNRENSSWIYKISLFLAILITLGFMSIPLTIYFGIVGD